MTIFRSFRSNDWTPKQVAIVTARYPTEGPRLLSHEFNRPLASIRSLARRHGLKLSPASLSKTYAQRQAHRAMTYQTADQWTEPFREWMANGTDAGVWAI